METLLERAIRWVCPYSLRQTTTSEENEIKRLVSFGLEVEQSIAAELARMKKLEAVEKAARRFAFHEPLRSALAALDAGEKEEK